VSAPPSPITGSCLCGSITYRVDAEPIVQAVCHCADCQRQVGGPFSVIVGVPRDALTVAGDTISSFSTVGEDHGQETERSFCSRCGAPVFSISQAMPQMAFIKAGSLDDAAWLEPSVEVWTDSAQPWSSRLQQASSSFRRGPA